MIDLHMHSNYSDDGTFSPEELVAMCHEQGVSIMSVTDHNCAKANAPAQATAAQKRIRYITGIEIDCIYEGVNFHLLGYGFDAKSIDFFNIEENIAAQTKEASLIMLRKTNELGFAISPEELYKKSKDSHWPDAWTGELFAEILLDKKEYLTHPLLLPYRTNGTRGDNPYVNFYWDYYAQGKPCYAKMNYPHMEAMIEVIHKNNGIAVLAHPQINLAKQEALLPKLLTLDLDGLEAFSSYHTQEQAAFYEKLASEKNMLITCGSDFHGKTKPAISLLQHHGTHRQEEIIRQLNPLLPLLQ